MLSAIRPYRSRFAVGALQRALRLISLISLTVMALLVGLWGGASQTAQAQAVIAGEKIVTDGIVTEATVTEGSASAVIVSEVVASPVTVEEIVVSETAAVKDGFGIIYPVPGGPRHVAPQAAGRIWFTSSEGDGVGLVTVLSAPGDAAVRYRLEFYGLDLGTEPYDIAYRNGVVWFTLRGGNALARMDATTREVTLYTLPTPNSRPAGLDIAPNGQVWIVAGNGRILRFDPDTTTFVEFVFPDNMLVNPRGEAIRFQNDRSIWFTLPDANAAGNYNSVTGRFLEVPTGETRPTGLAIDPSGNIWVTAFGSGLVGRYTPTTVSVWIWYGTPTANSRPAALLLFDEGGQRQLWLTESANGNAGRLQLLGGSLMTRTRVPLGSAPSRPWGIQRAPDRSLWIADNGRNVLIELQPPYIYQHRLVLIFR